MPDTQLLIELDAEPLPAEDLDRVLEVQVEESATRPTRSRSWPGSSRAPTGSGSSPLDVLLTPQTPVAVEVSRGDATYRFDGLSTEAAWEIDAQGTSRLTIKAVDRTLELDLEEKVVSWPGTAESAIAEAIFSSYGLATEVEATPAAPDPDVHVLIQRDTDLGVPAGAGRQVGLRHLPRVRSRQPGRALPRARSARRPPGPTLAGVRRGRPARAGAGRPRRRRARPGVTHPRCSRMRPRPPTPRATTSPRASSRSPARPRCCSRRRTSGARWSRSRRLPGSPAARPSPLVSPLEIDTAAVGLLLRAKRTVLVQGLGSALSGLYLVERVRHVLDVEHHRQQLTLVRNALGLTGDEPFGEGFGGTP